VGGGGGGVALPHSIIRNVVFEEVHVDPTRGIGKCMGKGGAGSYAISVAQSN
jgi:hypothetical protein